ncbi:trigger factor [Geitlerinema sp. PCC 9228]|jgi:trigger factor|uniref:trigger factor n=1 Tax=Geitlerinema sp. PCC 9228 TaxID=111611 RepID=UPI0008F9E215|nr:trigger factor [Geitlerinema sp. PCC 9228]
MKVTQEKLPGSQIGLEIEVPPEMSKQVYEDTVNQLKRSANIPGFRKGKVPRQILIQQLGPNRIRAAALEELIDKALKEAAQEESVESIPRIGEFQLRSSYEDLIAAYKPGEPLSFSVAADVQPEVELKQYQGLHVQVEQVEYDPQRVEDTIEEKRAEAATLVPVEGRPAQHGDVAIVDYTGYFQTETGETGEEIPGGSAENFQLELSEGRLLPEIIEAVVGMTPGESKETTITFPEDYGAENLAGETTTFHITLKELKEKELPELNDDLAKEISEFETIDELRQSLEEQYQKEAQQQTDNNLEQALVSKLLEQVEVDLPNTLIERQVNVLLRQSMMQLEQYGIDISQVLDRDSIPKLKEEMRPEAIQEVKQSLALQEIAKRESLELDENEIEQEIERLKQQLPDEQLDPDALRNYVEENMQTNKAMEWLKEHSQVEYVPEGTFSQQEEENQQEDPQEEAQPTDIDVEATTKESETSES